MTGPVLITAFRPADRPWVRALLLAGLAERWGGVADPGSAVGLYLRFGFRVTHHSDGGFGRDVHYALDLPVPAGTGKSGDSHHAGHLP